MKLDLDFYRDPKVRKLAKDKGEQHAWRWLKLCCLASSQYGRLDMSDPIIMDWVLDEMGLSAQKLDGLVQDCISCRLFDGDAWAQERILTSERMAEEGERMWNTEQVRSRAGKASGASRRKASAKQQGEE